MHRYEFGRGKWVFVDWIGVEPGYGTKWAGEISEGFCVPQGVELKVHAPDVEPAPVISPDQPWEHGSLRSYCTVIKDDGIFRCWYQFNADDDLQRRLQPPWDALAYAESDDGVTWKKRTVGLMEWNGSTDNNIVNVAQRADSVFIDPTAPVSERYKTVGCYWFEEERQVLGSVSPDGLDWTPLPDPLLPRNVADTQNIGLYDEELGKYVLYTRQRYGKVHRRGINRAESDEFARFPPSEPVWENDPLDPPDWDVYTNAYARWPGAVQAHLMRPSVFQHTSDTTSVHLATSRDGKIWHRPLGRRPWIEAVPSHGDPYLSMYACDGIVQTAPGEWSFYLGFNHAGHNDPTRKETSAEPAAAHTGFLRAVLREDGFTSLSSEGRGTFWTVPFELNSDRIRVNVRTMYSGFLRGQILASGTAEAGTETREVESIEGFELEACQPVSGDHIDIPLTWNGSTDLSALRGRGVRLRFDLYKADLFGIRF